MAEVKDYFTDAGTLDRQEFGNLFASSIHLHDDTACGRATLLQCLDTRYWPSPMTGLPPESVYRKIVGITTISRIRYFYQVVVVRTIYSSSKW